jgi:hypothetical protein
VAEACAAFGACFDPHDLDPLFTTISGQSNASGWFAELCTEGSVIPFATNAAERVIPMASFSESWPFFIRTVASLHGDCAAINQVLTKRNSATCQEDGCYSQSEVTVTCEGDVALIDGQPRDCTRSGMRCSKTSPTGCTDRPLTRCEAGASDRCDGDVKLGCDHCGFVSFHDCSWNGGHCRETENGAECVPPGAGCTRAATCMGTTATLCVGGQDIPVDCTALGFAGCIEQTALFCDHDASTSGCTVSACTRQLGAGGAGPVISVMPRGDAGVPREDAGAP